MFVLYNSCWIHFVQGNSMSGHCVRMTQGGVPAKEDGNEAGRDEVVEEKRYGDFD